MIYNNSSTSGLIFDIPLIPAYPPVLNEHQQALAYPEMLEYDHYFHIFNDWLVLKYLSSHQSNI